MKRKLFSVTMILLVVSLLPAKAQVRLDMTRITCGQWLGYDPERKQFVRIWLSGYFSASRNNDVLDLQYLQRNTEKGIAYCKTHKEETLISAIRKTAI